VGQPSERRPGGALALALAVGLAIACFGARAVEVPATPEAPGPALRAAIEALASGDAGALARFEAIGRAHPLVADVAERFAIDALAAAGRHAEAAARAREFGVRFPGSLSVGPATEREARARIALGDEIGARAAFGQARARAEEGGEQARLVAEIARSFERSGETARAVELWLELFTRHAATPAGAEAEAALARLAPEARPDRSFAPLAERSRVLFDASWNEEALAACDAALALAPEGKERESLASRRAHVLFRLRRYPEAERAFAALGPGREERFWRARSLARAGRTDEAIAAFEALAPPEDTLALRARFLAATLVAADDAGRALVLFRSVAEKARDASLRAEARWRVGWAAYEAGRFAEAAETLAAQADDVADPIEALRGRYWAARAYAAAGDPRGEAEMRALAAAYPFTYYGIRAAEHLGETPRPPAGPAPEEGPAALPADATARIRILLEAGLDADAGAEAARLARSVDGLPSRLALARLLEAAGRFHDAHTLAARGQATVLAAGPNAEAPRSLWERAWPRAWREQVERAAAAHRAPPALVWAVMREESAYDPAALSVVGARGLVQIMPATGQRLAAELGEPGFDAADLFDPARNIELGAYYLAQLLARFGGRVSAAVASYNAGPEAVARWLQQDGGLPDDQWVERIPYDQTRAYVRRVLRSLHAYRELYGARAERAAGPPEASPRVSRAEP
jgi:soluble lytic murein transglycosylase